MRRLPQIAALLIAFLSAPVSAQAAPLPGGIQATSGSTSLRVEALTDSILRVRVARDGRWGEDASWAVPSAVRAERAPVRPLTDGFSTAALVVHVDPQTLALTVTDLSGRPIVTDDPRPIRLGQSRFSLSKVLPVGERIYGLGDKTGNFDRRGESFVDWNTDAYGFQRDTDPIYKSIPFYIASGGPGGAYGLFLDNTWRSWFDFGHREANRIRIGADGGAIDYYLIAGPAVRDVVRRYTDLTGKAPLPPLWALGFQQSRYSYMSANEVRYIASTLREARIPSDVIWLDIDFQDRNRPFTTNRKTYPDLKKLASVVGAEGF
jgi:alpha-glucosidase